MTIGRYCQVCGAVKKPGEIIGEVHGVVLNADCLVAKVFAADAVSGLHSQVRFCRVCGAEQPKPLPDHCVKCGASLTAKSAAEDLLKAGAPAALGQRLAAFVLDLLPVALLAYLGLLLFREMQALFPTAGLEQLSGPEIYAVSYLSVFILYHTVFTALLGRTLGKMILGLRVVLADGTAQIGWLRSLMRSAMYFLTLYVMPLGAILVFLYEPPEKRLSIIEQDSLFHNPLSDTVVVKDVARSG